MRTWLKRALLALLALAPVWLLTTESGLRFGVATAETLSGGALRVREAHGRLAGEVRLAGIEVAQPAATVGIEQAELNLRLTRLLIGRVQAERLAVSGLTVAVHDLPPAPDRRPLRVRSPLRLAVEQGSVGDFRLRIPGLREWRLPQARFSARWRGEWIVIANLQADTREAGAVRMRGRVAIQDDLLQFDDFEVSQPSPVRVEGVLALTRGEESALRLSWEQLRWPGAGQLDWLHSPRGVAVLEGPWRRYTWQVEASTVAAGIPGELAARGRGDLRGLDLAQFGLRALGGTVAGQGRIEWADAVRTDLDLRWQGLDPQSRFAQWPGRLNGSATLRARWHERAPLLEFDGQFTDSQLRGYPLALQARGRTEQSAVFLQEFTAQSGASTLAASGQLWPQAALDGKLRSTDLRSLWAGLSGQASADFAVQGAPEALRFRVRANATGPGYRNVHARALAADANVGFRGHSEAALRIEGLEAGIALDELTLTGSGVREDHRATLALAGAEGKARLEFAGGERKGTWSGEMTGATLAPREGSPWQLEEPARLTTRLLGLRLEPACLRGADSRACVDLDLTPSQQRVAFRIHAFDLNHLRPWLPQSWTTTGTVSGTAALQVHDGELASAKADLAGSAGSVQGDGVGLEYGPGTLSVQPDGKDLVGALRLAPAGGSIEGEVRIAAGGALLDRTMLGGLRVQLPDLSFLPVLSPEVASARGSIDADLHVGGTLRSPSLDGRLQVAEGRVRLATPGIELTDLTASFERGRDAPLIARLSARSGDGEFTLDGVLRAMQPKLDGTFTLKGDRVLGFNTAEMRAWITPDLTLTLDGTHARLTGEVAVPRAEITPREINTGGIAPSSDQVVVSVEEEAQPSALQVESDVRIVLGDKVRFDGLGLKTRLEGAIAAHDEVGRPTTGRGELRLVGGRYKAYGQDLVIETGRLLFNGRITAPQLDLSAHRDLPAGLAVEKVGLRARGTLEQPEFSLYSEPALPQEQQLSWLVLGRDLKTDQAAAGQTTVLEEARTSLGLAGGDLLAQQLAPRLGLDEVSVGARPGETADLARLTIGKYLSPKLFVSYGVGLFQPGHFFRMQYDLTRRVKLVGESGLAQGGDVLYTIERGK
ncbi:MAG: translocation/assembly module TamB domain-containing protein [Gammaproteobacteria bacterium]